MKKLNNLLSFENLILLLFVLITLSINSSIADFDYKKIDIKFIFNFLRYISPIFVFILLIYFFLKNKYTLPNLYKLFIIYGLVQFISYLLNKNSFFAFQEYILIISMFCVCLIFIITLKENFKIENYYFFLVIIIFLISFFYTFNVLNEVLINGNKYLYISKVFTPEAYNFMGQQNPRSTGISRQLCLLLCFLIFFSNSKISNKFIIIKYFSYLGIFILSFIIWGYQSRGGLVSFILIWTIYLIIDKRKFLKKILFILFLSILPVLTYEALSELNINKSIQKISTSKKSNTRVFDTNKFKIQKSEINKDTGEEKFITEFDYTSGRVAIWKRSFDMFLKNPLIGYGPQGDRKSLSKDKTNIEPNQKHIWDNNASNGIIYSALSGGIAGLVIFTTIYFSQFLLLVKSLSQKKIFITDDYLAKNAFVIVIMLNVRTIYENGFAVFGIDQIFLITCLTYLLKFNYSTK